MNVNLAELGKLKDRPARYVRMEDGKPITLRLFESIAGFELWTGDEGVDRKPNRCKAGADNMHTFSQEIVKSAGTNKWGSQNLPYVFVAFVAYDYSDKLMKIYEVKRQGGQAKILNDLTMMQSNPKWGSLDKYDVTILGTKDKTSGKWSCGAQPEPADPKDKSAVEAHKANPVCLEALYWGLDPFEENVQDKIADLEKDAAEAKETMAVVDAVFAEEEVVDPTIPF